MKNAQTPSEQFHADFLGTVFEPTLSSYRMADLWSDQSSGDASDLRRKLLRWKRRFPRSISAFVSLLDALGYRLKIEKKQ